MQQLYPCAGQGLLGQKMRRLKYILAVLLAASACKRTDMPSTAEEADIIRVGAVSLDSADAEVDYTRAAEQDAEKQDWLVAPLKAGLDITYGRVGQNDTKNVAILKLSGTAGAGEHLEGSTEDQYAVDDATGYAVYSFKYKDSGEDAKWYGNGKHYFEGVYVPDRLRYGPGIADENRQDISSINDISIPGILNDQSVTAKYNYLIQYLGMPANTRLTATVGRIRLPFRHRLSRVIAMVLIDPTLDGVHLYGYEPSDRDSDGNLIRYNENPQTTSFRFCNVQVLEGVEDTKTGSGSSEHHVLSPKWKQMRKVVPHFLGEGGSMDHNGTEMESNFIAFYRVSSKEYIYPSQSEWKSVRSIYESAPGSSAYEKEKACGYRRINYGKVPVYDLIVRPTYSDKDHVMYDEDIYDASGNTDPSKLAAVAAVKNKIDFELTLSNGLEYTKSYTFDLNANYQTVVYLRINRESVDYNSSGASKWVETRLDDKYYGVDNHLGHSLSGAGSSWQRAYVNDHLNADDKVTDGSFYDEDTVGADGSPGQYVSDDTWINSFARACQGSAHHGDYFILKKDITIDARRLPDNFIFTGHLDGMGHTITLTNAGKNWKEYSEVTDYNLDKYYASKPEDLYSDEETAEYQLPTLYWKLHHDAVLYTEDEIVTIGDKTYVKETCVYLPYEPGGYGLTENSEEAKVGDVKVQAYDEYFPYDPQPQINEVMNNDQVYYTDDQGSVFDKESVVLYTYVQHCSGTALFSGLNGNYATAQESDPAAVWEANVHKEQSKGKTYWVPYRTPDSDFDAGIGSGWRAEILNLNIEGKLLKVSAIVTGNVQNCHENGVRLKDRIPAIPKYD